MLKDIYDVYGKELPGKTAFRRDEDAPVSIAEVNAEFGSWEKFEEAYSEYEPTAAPAPKQVAKKVVNTDAAK